MRWPARRECAPGRSCHRSPRSASRGRRRPCHRTVERPCGARAVRGSRRRSRCCSRRKRITSASRTGARTGPSSSCTAGSEALSNPHWSVTCVFVLAPSKVCLFVENGLPGDRFHFVQGHEGSDDFAETKATPHDLGGARRPPKLSQRRGNELPDTLQRWQRASTVCPMNGGALRDRFPRARVAGRTGLEPATSGVTGQCSNQLNYRPDTPR